MDGELLADQPLGQKLIKKGFWLYFFTFLIGPLGYFIKLIASNRLSVEDIGIFYSVLGLMTLLSSYNDLGLTEALQFFIPKYRLEKKYDNYKTIIIFTFLSQMISGIVIGGLLYLSSSRLAINHFHLSIAESIIKTMAISFFLVNFLQVILSIFYSFQDTLYQGLIEFIRISSILIFTIIFWMNNMLNISNFALFWVIGFSIATLAGILFFVHKYGYTLGMGNLKRDKLLIRKQISYAFWIFLGANIWTLFSQIDQQIIVNILGVKSAGYYTIYVSLIGAISIIILPILNIIFPITTELITKRNHYKLKMLWNIIYKYFSLFALILSGFFIAFGQEISTVLFTSKFAFSGQLVVYSSPLMIFNILYAINFGFMAGMGKVKERVRVLGIALIVNVVLNILFLIILETGLVGAVLAMGISWFVLWIISYRIIKKELELSFDWKFLFKNFFVISLLCLILYLIKGDFRITNDSYVERYKNIFFLIVSLSTFTIIIAGFNYKSIGLLFREIKNIRK